MTYKLIKALIAVGRTNGLLHKLDVFYAAGKLTDEEYTELVTELSEAE